MPQIRVLMLLLTSLFRLACRARLEPVLLEVEPAREGVTSMSSKVCVVLLLYCLPGFGLDSYPKIRPVERTFEVQSVEKADVVLNIDSEQREPLYTLQCHSAGYVGDPGFDYSGDFECRLSALYQPNTYSTLLTEDPDQSRDWESRARFFASDLKGQCAKIPQFGSMRSFRLRGMNLTLQIARPNFTDNKLKSLELVVTVRPDETARTPIAEAVPIPKVVPAGCKLNEHFVQSSSAVGTR